MRYWVTRIISLSLIIYCVAAAYIVLINSEFRPDEIFRIDIHYSF